MLRIRAHFALLDEHDALRVLDVLLAQASDDTRPPPMLLSNVARSDTPVRTLLVALSQALQRGALPSRGLLAVVLATSLRHYAPDVAMRRAMRHGIEVRDANRDALAQRLAELGNAGLVAWLEAQQQQPRATIGRGCAR